MPKVDTALDLKEAIRAGRIAVMRQRELLRTLLDGEANQQAVELVRTKLELLEELHAEDVAELRRLKLH